MMRDFPCAHCQTLVPEYLWGGCCPTCQRALCEQCAGGPCPHEAFLQSGAAL